MRFKQYLFINLAQQNHWKEESNRMKLTVVMKTQAIDNLISAIPKERKHTLPPPPTKPRKITRINNH